MSYCQTIIAAGLSLVMPVIAMAQEIDVTEADVTDINVTMEVIESLDDLNSHHRIKLPDQKAVHGALDTAVEKVVANQKERETHSEGLDVHRKQIDALIADSERRRVKTSVAHQRELGQNSAGVSAIGEPADGDPRLNDGIADLRTEMADRRFELADELTEDEPVGMPSAAISDQIADDPNTGFDPGVLPAAGKK